jgi:hypothetical protein
MTCTVCSCDGTATEVNLIEYHVFLMSAQKGKNTRNIPENLSLYLSTLSMFMVRDLCTYENGLTVMVDIVIKCWQYIIGFQSQYYAMENQHRAIIRTDSRGRLKEDKGILQNFTASTGEDSPERLL